MGRWGWGLGRGWGVTVMAAAAVACTSAPVPSLPADASPTQVLEAFLAAVEANNCAGAQKLESFDRDVHILCTGVKLNDYGPLASTDPSLYGNNAEFCFPVTLAGTPLYQPPFDSLCIVLTQQPDGRWLVASDGNGP